MGTLWNRSPGLNITEDWFSTAQYLDIKNSHHGFEQVAIAIGGNYNLTGWGEQDRGGTSRIAWGRSEPGHVGYPCWDSGRLSGDCLFPMRTCQAEQPPPCSVTEHGRGA